MEKIPNIEVESNPERIEEAKCRVANLVVKHIIKIKEYVASPDCADDEKEGLVITLENLKNDLVILGLEDFEAAGIFEDKE